MVRVELVLLNSPRKPEAEPVQLRVVVPSGRPVVFELFDEE